jgi:hypothetical protein
MLWSSYTSADLFGPRTYEDCILDGVKTAKTNDAVTAVYFACEKKFPSKGRADSTEKVLCGDIWVGKSERAAVANIPFSSKIGGVSIISSRWDGRALLVDVQNNYDFSLQAVRVKALLPGPSSSEIAYECLGYAGPKVVGGFYCNNFDSRIKYFNIDSVTSSEVNYLDFLKKFERCK